MKYLNALQHVGFHLCQKAFLSFNDVLDVDKDDLNVGHYDDNDDAGDDDVDEKKNLNVKHYGYDDDTDAGEDVDDDDGADVGEDDDVDKDHLNFGHYDDDTEEHPHLNVGHPHPLIQQHALGDSLGNALLQKILGVWREKLRYDIYQRQKQTQTQTQYSGPKILFV